MNTFVCFYLFAGINCFCMEDIYENDLVEIYAETFDTDFDYVGFDPIKVDDSDDDAAELFGY